MNKVAVHLCSFTGDLRYEKSVEGSLTRAMEEDILRYTLDGDPVEIRWSDKGVQMVRTGSAYLDLLFSEGKESKGKIGVSKESFGFVSVCTDRACVKKREKSTVIELKYELRFPRESQKTILRLTATEI